ncbi:MAG: DUF1704 domain-containing protein [Myxococcales bacterium]|nr:DUF1704 domain-containing protein [Myxococcales bacterium]
MVRADGLVHVVGRATPSDLAAELAALESAFRAGRAREPRFHYEPAPPSAEASDLERLADGLDNLAEPLAHLYAARARELALERRMCESPGIPAFLALARVRYARRDRYDADADALAREWSVDATALAPVDATALAPIDAARSRLSRSDDASDPTSLVVRMRAELGARRLAVQVKVSERMSALAATGDGVVYIAAGKRMASVDVERTVLHEIEGHALPRHRADSMPLGIFRFGTAHGTDDQEGRALSIEERCGFLVLGRRRELALRHLACRAVHGAASFVDTVAVLEGLETPLPDALRIAARAHRGGGLAREVVYLPAFLRVVAQLKRHPDDERILGAGRVSVAAAVVLREYTRSRSDDSAHDTKRA